MSNTQSEHKGVKEFEAKSGHDSVYGYWENDEFVLEYHVGSVAEAFFLNEDEVKSLVEALTQRRP